MEHSSVFISWAIISKYHKLGALKQKFILSQFWKLKVWNQGVSLQALGRILLWFFQLLSVAGNLWCSLACRCIIPVSASSLWFSPLCISLSVLLLIRTTEIGFKAHLHTSPHLNLTTSAKSLFPNNVTFTGFRWHEIWRDIIQPSIPCYIWIRINNCPQIMHGACLYFKKLLLT